MKGEILGVVLEKRRSNYKIHVLDGYLNDKHDEFYTTSLGTVMIQLRDYEDELRAGDIVKCEIVEKYITDKEYRRAHCGVGYEVLIKGMDRTQLKIR